MQSISIGDTKAFAALVNLHSPRAWRLAMRFLANVCDAEEALQDSFAKVWTKANSFDPQKASFSTWFYTLLTRQCLDVLRKRRSLFRFGKKLDPAQNEALLQSLACPNPDSETIIMAKAEALLIKKTIDTLPQKQRNAVILCYLEDMKQVDAAKILGIHQKALEALLHRAKLTLKQKLGSFNDHQ